MDGRTRLAIVRNGMRETRFEDCGATSRKPRSKYAVIYAHRGDGDTWLQVFSENLRLLRVQRSGKPNARGPLRVIAGYEDARVLLEDSRQQTIEELKEYIAAVEHFLSGGERRQRDPEERKRMEVKLSHTREQLDAARLTTISGPEALKAIEEPKNTALEVVHHGRPGSEYLAAHLNDTSSRFLIADLPAHWRSLGLSRDIGSIKLLSCGSGDAEPRDRFVSYPRGYFGPPSTDIAPAQRLADKMKAMRFTQPRVIGYQGSGLNIASPLYQSRTYVESIWDEDVSLPDEPYSVRLGDRDGVTTDVARRSDVSMIFEPTDADRGHKRLRFDHAYMYAPRGDGDTFEFALEENVRRLAKWIDAPRLKPRGPIALIAPNDNVINALATVRASRMLELSREVKRAREERRACEQALSVDSLSEGERNEKQTKIDEHDSIIKERSFYLAAAEATEIKGLDVLTKVENAARLTHAEVQMKQSAQIANTKIYIALFGSAGSDRLTTDRSDTPTVVTLAEISHDLARHFVSEGLTPRIGSFRLLSWESADSKPRRKFEANPSGASGFFSNRRLAPAQYLANQLQEDGFLRPRVTGYQGQGGFWNVSRHSINEGSTSAPQPAAGRHQGWGSDSIAPPHALRTIPGHASDWKRRKEVGKVFKPKSSGLLCY
jgi:hypothetical protein